MFVVSLSRAGQTDRRVTSLSSFAPHTSRVSFSSPISERAKDGTGGSSSSRRIITFTEEDCRGVNQINVQEANLNLRLFGWSQSMNLWIRARMGSKRLLFWTLASDNELLRYIVCTWAHDSQEFFFALRRNDRPAPNTIRV
ncbi:hypothetical protein PTTG_08533 [Puccinia triticina 1-1 BBBD Race 1]|uniref:Uncharacterized protein n=2 Tax=Puccinia triticina TaxID=208348 RepID=A0A0C4F5X8_PUCT1|nr:uncharacterized protein PtA15_9A508 [Puccinia triticina]OAV98475.1 hypothetical protein PTTG_08533 [Puccinia triticina 1-1 BBBD Race 1]WAQ88381.1 hypothetical protein PtA15_9A508 [Puccinia triticina]WAR60559.1 hypothetical protein PtB15_9B498 [Puccinia triticina]